MNHSRTAFAVGLVVAAATAVALVVAAGAAIWLLVRGPAPASAAVAAGVGFLISKLFESAKESRARLYETKREVYWDLLGPWLRLLSERERPLTAEDIAKEMGPAIVEASFRGILYASDDVLREHIRMRRAGLSGDDAGPELLLRHARMLKAMRKDLGHTFTSLSEVELLEMFVNMKPENRNTLEAIRGHLPAR